MPERWQAPPEVLDWVRDVLHAAVTADDDAREAAVAAVRQRWWRPLLRAATDPGDGVDRLVWSAAAAVLAGERAAVLRRRLVDACTQAWRGADVSTAVWRILYRFTEPTPADARRVVDELDARGVPLSAEVAAAIMRLVDAEPGLTAEGLGLLDVVDRHGHGLPPALTEQVAHDRVVRGIVDDLPRPKPELGAADLAARIAAMPAGLREVRLPELVTALLATRSDRAAAVLGALDTPTFTTFGDALRRCWPQPGRPVGDDQGRAAALVFVVTGQAFGTAREADFAKLRQDLGQHVTSLGKDERAAIFRALPRAWQGRWATWVRELDPGRLRRHLDKVTSTFRADPDKREG
jgi:hypothetical protein